MAITGGGQGLDDDQSQYNIFKRNPARASVVSGVTSQNAYELDSAILNMDEGRVVQLHYQLRDRENSESMYSQSYLGGPADLGHFIQDLANNDGQPLQIDVVNTDGDGGPVGDADMARYKKMMTNTNRKSN